MDTILLAVVGPVTDALAQAPQVTGTGDRAGLPGSNAVQSLINGGIWLAAMVCLAGMVGAGIGLAIGKHTNNSRMGYESKSYLGAAAAGAVVVGGAVALVNFFLRLGGTI